MKTKSILIILIFIFSLFSHAEKQAHKIVFIGDSLTEGYGISSDNSFPKLIEKQLKKKHQNITIVNAGSSGSTSASAVSRLKWLIKSKPTIIFIALGANDGLRGLNLKQTEKNLQNAITIALDKKIKVILAGVRMPPNYGKKFRSEFENIFKNLAKNNSLTFIPYLLKDVAGVTHLNLADRIHPNEAGHVVISKTVLPYIEGLL